MLTVKNAFKSFGSNQALAGVSIDFEPGQTTALIGPSGCGKSTLLRLLIGLVWPERGEVEVFDQRLAPTNVRRLRHRMGYMIQDGGLFPHLTAQQNVTLQARSLGWQTKQIDARIETLAGLVHLSPSTLARYPAELSGGQQQRVSLMRALMLDPDVLLLDEPLGALDPLIRSDLQEELRGLFQSLGKTVVLVTHDLYEAAFLSSRLVLMRSGKIVQQGSANDFAQRPAEPFVSQFVQAYRRLGENPLS